MNKKAQIQIMQTVIIIIVVFIILFIGFIFYMQYSKDSAAADIEKMDTKKSILAASYVLAIPEIACSQKLDIKQNCFDSSKMLVFNASKNVEYYSDYFYTSNINVLVFFGNASSGVCDPSNYPNCNQFILFENKPEGDIDVEPYYIPVSVFNPFDNTYSAAYATIEVFT